MATVLAPRYASSAEVGLLNPLEAVLGPIFVYAAVGESPSRWTLFGGALLMTTLIGHEVWDCRYAKPSHAHGATGVKCHSVMKQSHHDTMNTPSLKDASGQQSDIL